MLPQLIEDLLTTDNRHRALLVLVRMENGALRRIAAADRLLFCTNCFGVLAGPDGGSPPAVKISNGVIIVNHLWGSNEATDHAQRFRYDATKRGYNNGQANNSAMKEAVKHKI